MFRSQMFRSALILSLFFLLPRFSRAQSTGPQPLQLTFENSVGEFALGTTGTPELLLQLSGSQVNSVGWEGESLFGGALGPVDFITPTFTNGTVRDGGSFGSGGSFYISPVMADTFLSATFVRGTWRRVPATHGRSHYVLLGVIEGTLYFQGASYSITGITLQTSLSSAEKTFAPFSFANGGVTNVTVVGGE